MKDARMIAMPPHARRVLPNGLTVLVLERRQLPLIAFRLVARAGSSRDPADLPGLSALTARLLRHGAGKRSGSQFAADLDFLGARFGTSTGLDQLVIEAELTTPVLERGLDLVTDAILRPRLAEADFTRERERAVAEIVQSRDEPGEVADHAVLHELYAGHPYGHAAQGTETALARATADDVRAHHRRVMSPRGAILVVAGDVECEPFLARLASLMGDWQASEGVPADPPEPVRPSGRRTVLVRDPGSTQVQVRIASLGVARRTPHWHALGVASAAFGGGFTSRLVREARVNRGLTYGIHSRFAAGRVAGPFVISTFTRNASLAEMHQVISACLRELHEQGLTAEELARAKAFLVGLQLRRLETLDALASAHAEAELFDLGPEAVTGYRRDVEAVDAAAAQAAIAACFPKDDLLTVLVGDEPAIRPAAEAFGPLTVLDPTFAEGPRPAVAPGPAREAPGGPR